MAVALHPPKPEWLKVRPPGGESYARIKGLLREHGLHTVCEEARCPNVAECWGGGTATFMLLGDTCTRACRFCAVAAGNPRGTVDPWEPLKIARTVAALDLTYVVLTSVCRDDLPDGGADHFARTVEAIHRLGPDILVEALIPDFQGDRQALARVVAARPDVLGHNVETVERLTPLVRDRRAKYRQSLEVLETAKVIGGDTVTKSSLMLGLGETEEELRATFADLRAAGVDILTLGQYLRPTSTRRHVDVVEYVTPERFERYRQIGLSMAFRYVAAGPLVRSSYRAGEYFLESLLRGTRSAA